MRFPRFKNQQPLDDIAAPPPKISNPILHHSSISFEESKKMHKTSGYSGSTSATSSSSTGTNNARGPSSSRTREEPSLELSMLEMNNDFSKLLEIIDTDYTQVPELSESPGDGGPRASDPTAVEPPELFTEDTKEWSPNTLNPEGIQAKFIPATPMRESSRRFSVRGSETELTPPEEWSENPFNTSSDENKGSDGLESSSGRESPPKPAVPPKDLKPKRKDARISYADAQVNGAPVAVAYGAIAAPARSTSMRSSGSTLKAAFSSSSSPKEVISTHPRVSSRRFSRELQLKQHLGESEKEKEATSKPVEIKSNNSTIEEYKIAISRLNEIRLLQIRQRDERIAQLEAMVMRQQQTSIAKLDQFEAITMPDDSGDSSDSSSHTGTGTRGIQNMRALFPIA